MNIDINCRQNKLTNLQNYLKDVDTEVTMILQNLQWDRKHLAEGKAMAACRYDKGHRVPPDKLMEHENECFLKSQGYTEQDCLLPNPIDPDATTLIKLSGDDIAEIIKNASYCQPTFSVVQIGSFGCDITCPKVKSGCSSHQPLTLERLQATYTAEERRAIHDAVVNRVPSCHDLSDLALLSCKDNLGKESKAKSKLEILAELRDMRRRRTKYRVAAKTRNYSDVLRDVITTQMELYTQANNSMTQIHSSLKNNDPDSNSKAKNSADEKNTAGHCSNTTNRKSQRSTSTMDVHNISRHSWQHDEYETRTRRHIESDHGYNSTSASSKTDRDREHYRSKSKRRNDEYYPVKADRKSFRHHEQYDSRNKYREKEYDRKGIARTAQDNFTTTKDKTKDRRYLDSKLEEKYRSNGRHSTRVKKEHDKPGNTKLSPKSRDLVDRQERYESRREQVHTVKIKKEKDDYYDDDSNSSEDNETEYTDTASHDYETYSGMKKIKVEKDLHLRREENIVEDDRGKDYGSKSSRTFYEYPESKIVHNRHINSSTYKDKHKYHEKKKHRPNYNYVSQQECTEQAIQKIKQEHDVIYEKPLDANDSRQDSRVEDDGRYENRNERFRSRDNEYRR